MSRVTYGVKFNGRTIVHPGGYDHIDASGMEIVNQSSDNLPIVLGEAISGEPGVVKWFTSATDAKQYLRGGELYEAMDMIFSPDNGQGSGASAVGVLVVNPTTQASLTQGGLSILSKEYGEGGNKVQVTVSQGTMTGTKKLIVSRWDLGLSENYDNLGGLIKLQYTGESAYASVEVVYSSTTPSKIVTKVGTRKEDAQEDVSISLDDGQYPDIASIVKYFQSLSDYSASFVNYRNAGMSVTGIDKLDATPIKGTAGVIKGVKADIIYQANTMSEIISIDDKKSTGTLQNIDHIYLSGGTKGQVPSSWSKHFETLKRQYANILVVLSSSEAIHAEALAHINMMETRKQKRILICGGGLLENVERAKERASLLNSSRAISVYPGIYHSSHDGGKNPTPAYMSGALIAGKICGVDPAEPITFDTVNAIGLANDLISGDTEIDDLITSGVLTLERVLNGGIRIVQGITTYLDSNNTLYREISVRRGADAVSDYVTTNLEKAFVGKKGLRATASAVETKAMDLLDYCVNTLQYITAYRNIRVTFANTAVYVDYEVAPAEPINFVLVTSHFVPDSQIE